MRRFGPILLEGHVKTYLILAGTLTMLGSAQLHAQGAGIPLSPNDIVAIRQSMMELQQGVLGAMKAAVAQKVDVKPFTVGAKGLAESAKVIAAMFPPGTEKANETRALPAIWSDKADFAAKSKALQEAAEKLVTLADADDKAGFATQFVAVDKTCVSCHRQYRAKQ
ncbi:MAG: cytochrome c [Acetobacteraceae bacterium]|nr:cytochrome c [Acetobacteraceae bacterium]